MDKRRLSHIQTHGNCTENTYAYGHPCEELLGILLTGCGNNIMEKQK